MHPQLKQILVYFIQAAALLWLCFPSALSQNNEQDAACFKSFECGRVTNLSYPFWGGNRSLSCGYPGFELNCNGDVPLLDISSLTYRLLRVDFSTYTLTVARQDLWNNICPAAPRNTTLDPVHFEISPDTGDGAVTLYYGCTSNQPIRLQNSFNCSVGGVTTVNIFVASGRGPGSSIRCDRSISVPVNRTAAVALRTATVSLLQEALASGFSIRWSADNENCESCRRSTGTCGYNQDTGASVCDTRKEWRGPVVEVGAPRPPLPRSQPPAGMPSSPPEAAAPAPETDAFNRSNPALSVPRVSNSGVSRRVWIVAGVVIGMVGIISMVVLICYLNRRRLRDGSNLVHNKSIEKILHQHGYLALKRYKHSEIKKITKSFNDKLGQGGYGSVYKGMLPDGCPVAVKVLTEINSDGEEFINEVVSISRTSHVNIVNLLGFCYDGNKRALVYDFMPNKSLDKFISTSAECHLDLDKLYKIAVGVAKGLEYLHTGCSARIVHFDIKPQNILLDEDFCPKISDFGLAKLCKKKQSALSLLGTRGTIGYIAPEIFSRNYGKVSHKSDVYSYGMMVLEMVGANKIVQTEVSQSSENYFPDKIYELVTRDNTGNPEEFAVEQEEEEDATRKMILVGFWCIQTSPLDRPLMSKVVEMLEGSVESIEVPPKPVLFTPSLPQHDFSPSLSACTETDNSEQVIANTQTQVLTIV